MLLNRARDRAVMEEMFLQGRKYLFQKLKYCEQKMHTE